MPKVITLSSLFSDAKSNGAGETPAAALNMTTKAYSKAAGAVGASSDELPDRIYVPRNSLLTEMLTITDIRTIRHIFISIMIVLGLQVVFSDVVDKGRLDLNFDLVTWCFGQFQLVFYTWLYMTLSTLIAVYSGFHYWSNSRLEYLQREVKLRAAAADSKKQQSKSVQYDYIWLGMFVAYMLAFLVLPASVVVRNRLPPASSFVVLMEQLRMIMKTYAFVRSNVPRAIRNGYLNLALANGGASDSAKFDLETKTTTTTTSSAEGTNIEEVDEDDDEKSKVCPNFSNYLYFLFAPTLVYRDSYPRTKRIRWNLVFYDFAQVIGAILYTNYIFERFCIPVFSNFNTEHVSLRMFIYSILNCTLAGTLLLLVAFFAFLHCWLNAWGEMLRFADRMFYKDWWNSSNFSNYYRTWNVVVHDWLYTYIYKDCFYIFGKKQRVASQFVIFFVSAVFHEYVLTLAFGFFFPVLFLMFGAVGFLCIFLKPNSKDFMNLMTWLGLYIGLGALMCLYSVEWYARLNCPKSFESSLVDYLLPRAFTCGMGHKIESNATRLDRVDL